MKQDELKRMYGSTPEAFTLRVEKALHPAETPARRTAPRLRLALTVGLAALLLAATALAVFHSRVAEWFGRENPILKEDLENGRIAPVGESVTLGSVVFTLEEVTYIDDGLYAVGRIAPAPGANVLLLSEDQEHIPDDPVGIDHYTDETPSGPTYGEKAAQTGARMLLPRVCPEGVGVEDGPVLPLPGYGSSQRPQADGSLLFTLEMPTGTAVTPGESYVLELWVEWYEYNHFEESFQGETWTVTAVPQPAKEEQP